MKRNVSAVREILKIGRNSYFLMFKVVLGNVASIGAGFALFGALHLTLTLHHVLIFLLGLVVFAPFLLIAISGLIALIGYVLFIF